MTPLALSSDLQMAEAVPAVAKGHHATGHQALFFLCPATFNDLYGPAEQAALARRVAIGSPLLTQENYRSSTRIWPGVDILFSGWGMVPCDAEFLGRFPDLKVIFYAGGTIRYFMTEAFWDRGVRITSSTLANAIPVSEYALSQILFGLKQGWQKSLYIRRHRHYPPFSAPPGAHGSIVGLISLGTIGRLVAKRLRTFDVHVIAYDPFVDEADANELGVTLVSLEELFRRSDVVSCHAPDLEETRGMITATHFAAMKPGATFINTARGRLVQEPGMVEVLVKRPDLIAVLDVTHPEPPVEGSPLYYLENIVLTPHIAGSLGGECQRMGRLMVDELDRYLAGQPLRHEVYHHQSHLLA
jgi:phosphoglycerate dehydrogenase-like enzyme